MALSLLSPPSTGVIDLNPAHHIGGSPEKVPAAVPMLRLFDIAQAS